MYRNRKDNNNNNNNNKKQRSTTTNASSSSSSLFVVPSILRGGRNSNNSNNANNTNQRGGRTNSNGRNNNNDDSSDNQALSAPAQVLLQVLRQQQKERDRLRRQQHQQQQLEREQEQQLLQRRDGHRHHKQKRRGRDEEEEEEETLLSEDEAFALASVLESITQDDEEQEEEEEEEEEDDDEDSSSESCATTIISVETRTSFKNKKQTNDQEDDDEEGEEEEEGEEDELIIEAEFDQDCSGKSQQEIVNQISDAARSLIRVCPNFSALRFVAPPVPAQAAVAATAPKKKKTDYDEKYLLPPLHQIEKFANRSNNNVLTLVIDLDETIVQSRNLDPNLFDSHEQRDLKNTANWYFNQRDKHIVFRPYLDELVRVLTTKLPKDSIEVVIWTASERDYCTTVLNHYLLRRSNVNPNQENAKFWDHVITREDCLHPFWESCTAILPKNLSWLGRDLDKCMLLENSPGSSHANPDNAILVPDFHNNDNNIENTGKDESLRIAAKIIEYVHGQVMEHQNSVERALQQRWCSSYLAMSSFRVQGVRGSINVRTLCYCPPGAKQRTFGEEAHRHY